MEKVALITGANSGIGLALSEKLLTENSELIICLACRNQKKAESAKRYLQQKFPTSNINLLPIDTSCLKSVLNAAKQVIKTYDHVDYLYLNAGILPVSGVNWTRAWKGLFSKDCIHMFATGDGVLKQMDSWTDDGLKQVFATNVFGHFVFVDAIRQCLGGKDSPSQVIWTSSANALKQHFNLSDIQHSQGTESYGSSKYIIDMVSVVMNEKHNAKFIYSHTTCPGLVMTNVTEGILPHWVWFLLLPFFWLLRIFVPSTTLTPENGCQALYWLSTQKPEALDPRSKFQSCATAFGKPYIKPKQMEMDLEEARETYRKLEDLKEQKTKHLNNE